MLQTSNFIYSDSPYPFLVTDNLLNKVDIASLNVEHNNFFQSGIKAWSGGQECRENIVLTENNAILDNYTDAKSSIRRLFHDLNSFEFRRYLYQVFNNSLHPHGFAAKQCEAFFESTLEVQLCRSVDGYENPIHVDTRKRIVHALIYLEHQDLVGGEFDIAAHTSRPLAWDYPQFPHPQNISCVLRFKPTNNRSIFILSTPNSYHRGVKSKGIRNFLYIGYNYPEIAWKSHVSWQKPKPFSISLTTQKQHELSTPLPTPIDMCIRHNSLQAETKRKMIRPVSSPFIGSDDRFLKGLSRTVN